MQAPILDAVAGEVSGRVKVAKVDVDQNEQAARRFQVDSIPTLVLLRDGAEVRRFVGVQPRETLVSAIETALSGN
jgi:thioredoxin-like negative regulator of GroEL